MSEWQPIETAPKDGTLFIIYAPDNVVGVGIIAGVGVAKWSDYLGYFVEPEEEWRFYPEPTHWMPLPLPPTENII